MVTRTSDKLDEILARSCNRGPDVVTLAERVARLAPVKASTPSADLTPHDAARDSAQAIFEHALAALPLLFLSTKKEKEEAILLLLLLSGEEAYTKAYTTLGTETLKSFDPIQVEEQARTFAEGRQPLLRGFAKRMSEALEAARDEAREAGLGKTAVVRELKKKAQSVGSTMASTEAQAVYGNVQEDRLKRAGFKTKIWQTQEDELVRPSHVDCGEQGPVELSKPFVNGLMYPGDPNGGPEEVCNCRCYLIGGGR